MMDLKKIIFNQVKERFVNAKFEIDTLNIVIFINQNSGKLQGFLKEESVFDETLEPKDLTMIQKMFVKKVVKVHKKKNPESEEIVSVFLELDLTNEEYKIYLFDESGVLSEFEF